MKSTQILSLAGLVSVLALSTGCTGMGLAVGVGAKTGIEAAKEGGLRRAASDISIQTQINNLWFQRDLDIFRKLDLTVSQGRVLITGVVQDSHHRVEAVRLAWQPNGVKQVINEIKVAEGEGISGFARDVWITTQLKTKLTLDKEIQSINFSIDTVQGTVYLMGVARNQMELNRVIDKARTVSGVKEVVSYVKFAGQPLTQETLNSAPAPQPDYNQYNSLPDDVQYNSQYNGQYNGQNQAVQYSSNQQQGTIGEPIGGSEQMPASPYSNVSPAAGGNVVHPTGPSPMAQPEPYVARGQLPPPGQWAGSDTTAGQTSDGSSATYAQDGNSGSGSLLRQDVQTYSLND